jgi:transposase InsO family protein
MQAVKLMKSDSGWQVNHKRVERIWRQEGLKVPKKQPKRGRLWLNDGSCIRLRPTHRNHVWSYDFVMDRTHYGRPIKILTLIDEYSRHCLALVVDRSIKSDDVLHTLSNLFLIYGRVYSQGCSQMVGTNWCKNSLHRASQSMGKRL